MYSCFSWPYWWSSSEARLDSTTPKITMMVLNTSEAEWMASEIMAAEWPKIPARNLKVLSIRLMTMLT